MTTPTRRGGRGMAVLALLASVAILGTTLVTPAFAADDELRIQDVTSSERQVQFLLDATGLDDDQAMDPSSVSVTIDGVAADATATSVQDGTADITRTALLTLDLSGSMAADDRIGTAKTSAEAYVAGLPDDVRVGLITFADDATVVVEPTTRHGLVTAAIRDLQVDPDGSTALFDATALAVRTLGKEGGRNILMLSDGEDEGSRTTQAQAVTRLKESGVVLDAVSLQSGVGDRQLGRLTNASGGVLVSSGDAATVTQAFEDAARAVGNQLVVTAVVPDEVPAGTVELTATVEVDGATLTDSAVVNIDALPTPEATDFGAQPVPVSSQTALAQNWVLLVGLAVLFLALAVVLWLALRTAEVDVLQKRATRRRVGFYTSGAARNATGNIRADASTVGSRLAHRAVEMADSVVKERDPDRSLERRLDTAGIPLKPAEWAVLHLSIAFTTAMVFTLISDFSILWTLVGLAVGLFVPFAYLDIKGTRRKRQFYEALPDALQLLGSSVASGYSFPQAVDAVARESVGVLGDELTRAVAEARLGVPIEDALEDAAVRMDSRDFEWVIMAVRINRRVGGNLSEVLKTVANTLRERERVRRHVAALTAEGRLSAIILGSLPLFLVLYLVLVRPEYIGQLLTAPLGWVMIGVGVFLLVIGAIWMNRMIKVEV